MAFEHLRTDLLSHNRRQGLAYFEYLLRAAGIKEAERIVRAAYDGIVDNPNGELKNIQERWYEALRGTGEPDYSVYEPDLYLAEVWLCWFMYPRPYLRDMQKSKSLPPDGIIGSLAGTKTIVDLGNGLGATSAALRMLFPEARIIGTNVPDSAQMRMGELLAQAYQFEMVEDVSQIDGPIDLVFASEYFEHFPNPTEHLNEIVKEIQPSRWLIANTFGGDSIGHFDEYEVDGEIIHGSKMGRPWGNAMRSHGYEKVKTNMWNNRPMYYVRPEDLIGNTVRRMNQGGV